MRRLPVVIAAVGLLAACGSEATGTSRPTMVAAVYPLAWAAEEVAGPGWEVIDLTPPGAEAHDIELTLEQRTAIQDADVVLYLGDIEFQPQVERAVDEASGTVVDVTEGLELLEGHAHEEEGGEEGAVDAHVWLDPGLFAEVIPKIVSTIEVTDAGAAEDSGRRADDVIAELKALDERYQAALEACASDTLVVSHEAFGYPAKRYGLHQVGLAELVPEAEPTVEALGEAGEALRTGEARAVFHEIDDESRRIAESIATDVGVPALPLNVLESRPVEGDYLSVMDANLASLRRGLGCA